MKLLKITTILAACILLFFSVTVVHAQTIYYVATTGDNSTGTSWATAFTSIQTAINSASSGDIVYIAAGTYSGGFTANVQDLEIRAYTGGVIVEGSGSGVGATVTTTGVEIQLLTFQNFDTGVQVNNTVLTGGSFDIIGSYLATSGGIINYSPVYVNAFGNKWFGGGDPDALGLITGPGATTVYYTPWLDSSGTPNKPWGDITLNGTLSAYDASGALKNAVGITTLTGDAFNIGDVNYDGSVNETDGTLMLQKVVELITSFSVETFMKVSMPYVDSKYKFDMIVEEDDIIVFVSLEDAKKVFSSFLELEYDPAILEFKSFKAEPNKEGNGPLVAGFGENGIARIAAASAEEFGSDELKLGRFVFAVNDKEADAEFTATTFRINGHEGVLDLTLAPAVPTTYKLFANYPNPFNPETYITFQLPERADVVLEIYNILGQVVKTYNMSAQPAGIHKVRWDGRNNRGLRVSSGVYLYMLRSNGKLIGVKRMTLIK